MAYGLPYVFVTLATISLGQAQRSTICSTVINGTTANSGSTRIAFETPPVNLTAQYDTPYVRLDTCSDLTRFDTELFLYVAGDTTPIDSCDTYCSSYEAPVCVDGNGDLEGTTWDIPIDELEGDAAYVLAIKGAAAPKTFAMTLITDCEYTVEISRLVPSTTFSPCEELYPCPFEVLDVSIDGDTEIESLVFNKTRVFDILQSSEWTEKEVNVYNHETRQTLSVVLNVEDEGDTVRAVNNGDSYWDFQVGDLISFVDIDVFCDGTLCSSASMEVGDDRFSVAWLIVLILLVFVCCCVGGYRCRSSYFEKSFPYNAKTNPLHNINWIFCEMHEDASYALCKILSQLLITFCSAISSAALSGAFDETSGDNGILAIAMSCLVILLGFPKFCFSCMTNPGTNKEELRDNVLTVVIGISTLFDAIFDILQGIALINGLEYNDDSAAFLVAGTFIGLSEEIVDLIHTMVSGVLESAKEIGDEVRFAVGTVAMLIELLFLVIELILGIVIFAGFDGNTGFVVAAICLQSVGFIFVFLVCCMVYGNVRDVQEWDRVHNAYMMHHVNSET